VYRVKKCCRVPWV